MPDRSFAEIGFSCNPFRALTREEWVRAAVLPVVLRPVVPSSDHLQILGGTGSGKTTALLALEHEFHMKRISCAYERIPIGGRRYRNATSGLAIFLLDEAQRLARGILSIGDERARLMRAAKSGVRLILGTHEDLSGCFRQAGVSLQTVRLEPPDFGERAAILERRLELFACRDERARFSEEAVNWLGDIFRGDLRAMEYFLYDFFQNERPAGVIAAGPLREVLRAFTPPAAGPE